MSAEKKVLMIGVVAGIVSALMPSVPTILRFWNDPHECEVMGFKFRYKDFLHVWVLASAIFVGYIAYKFMK